jgi:hypothetical protein
MTDDLIARLEQMAAALREQDLQMRGLMLDRQVEHEMRKRAEAEAQLGGQSIAYMSKKVERLQLRLAEAEELLQEAHDLLQHHHVGGMFRPRIDAFFEAAESPQERSKRIQGSLDEKLAQRLRDSALGDRHD